MTGPLDYTASVASKKISFDPESNGSALRRIVLGILILVGIGFLLDATLMRIDAGHVGIKVKLAGSARGTLLLARFLGQPQQCATKPEAQ